MRPKTYKKKPDLNSKAGKYFLAKSQGMTKKDAAITAGYNPTHTTSIEATQTYQEIEKKYLKDVVLQELALVDIAKTLARNALQDKDLGASNTALKLAMERVEPESNPHEENETVLFVLKK